MLCPKCGAIVGVSKDDDTFIEVKNGKVYARIIPVVEIDMLNHAVTRVQLVCPICGMVLKEQAKREVKGYGRVA